MTLTDHVGGFGDERYDDRSVLRAVVWEISGGTCEHPVPVPTVSHAPPSYKPCGKHATEMAHIVARGMGHHGYRDYPNNVMAACPTHARSTDDPTSPEWETVRNVANLIDPTAPAKEVLTKWVKQVRESQGWAM